MKPPVADRAVRRRLLLLLLAASLYKLVYLVQYARLPFLRSPLYDSLVYLRQARAVLDGRFGDAALLAFSPLYGYFLALCGGGALIGAPILLQLGLGTLNLYLVHRFVRPRFGEAAALLSAALYFGYGLLLSYESKIVSETLALTLALLATGLYQSAGCAAGRPRPSVGAGALLGLAVLQRASLIFVPPLAVAAAALPWADAPRGAGPRRALFVALGLAVVFGGNGLWSYRHSGLFVPVILVSGTVMKTTERGFDDDFSAFSQNASGVANAFDVVLQAERRLADRRAGRPAPPSAPLHLGERLAAVALGAPIKLAHALSDYEVTYDYGYFGERSEVAALRWLPVSFGTLLLLGILGAAALALRSGGRALVPYLPFALGSLATTVVFHSSSRYRLFLVVPLLLLAGHGVVSLARVRRPWLRAALGLPVAALCGCLVARTLSYQMIAPAQWELRVAQSAAAIGDRAEFQRRVSRARRLAPDNPVVEARIRYLGGGG